MSEILAKVCPVCDALYAEHSLDELAGCMEEALGEPGLWTRRLEVVDTELL